MRTPAALAVVLLWAGCARPPPTEAPESPGPPPTRPEIWAAIQAPAARYRLDPAFIYALVAAESNFDPLARNGSARGLLQLKPAAWRAVSNEPYATRVWDWRANLAAGIDYLAYLRSDLRRRADFSLPLLLAAFHDGPDYVAEQHYDLRRLKPPDNAIYRQLWAGNPAPVRPP